MALCPPTSLWYLTNGPPSFGPQGQLELKHVLKERLTIVGEKKNQTPTKSTKKVGKAKVEKVSPAKGKRKLDQNEEAAPPATIIMGTKAAKEESEQSKAGSCSVEIDESPIKAVLDQIRTERRRSSRLTNLIVESTQK
jgi:hypothetical protein